jgi:tetratricopeptide (TPR) repeat protein
MWLGAERALVAVEEEYWTREINRRTNEDCAEKIQLWGGSDREDAELMFLFGQCLVASEQGYDARGRDVLLRAIELYPQSPRRAVAWETIGIAAKRTGDTMLELQAYTRALETAWSPFQRAELYLRRGHAHMRSGDLVSAIADLRIAWRESVEPAGGALAEWALAVALDRSYDLPSALPHARAAAAVRMGPAGTLTALELQGFDLEPAYEVHYYRALPHLADAQQTSDPADLVGSLEAAQALFLAYIKAAGPDDRWVPRAREHVEALRARLSTLLTDDSLSADP